MRLEGSPRHPHRIRGSGAVRPGTLRARAPYAIVTLGPIRGVGTGCFRISSRAPREGAPRRVRGPAVVDADADLAARWLKAATYER